MKALTFSTFGDSSVLDYTNVPDPILKDGEILLEMRSIGLNFADIYRRNGNYHLVGNPPFIAGYEGAGIVVNANGHSEFKVGDRVAFADVPLANAELVAVPVAHAIPLPDYISFEVAASVLLQGLTAHYLATDSHQTKVGDTVLIHAVAGGVGQILTQISKILGATVVGLTSSPAKADVALKIGADVVFLYQNNWVDQIFEVFSGGLDVIYDSVGNTLKDSLKVAKTRGKVVFYGMSGGDSEPVDPRVLMDSSKTITGGDLWNYLNSRAERVRRAGQLFDWIRTGKLILSEPTAFKLSDGKAAHDFLESRKSTGKIILIP